MTKLLLLIYKILSVIFLPIVIIIIFFRIFQNKEINNRIKERFSFPSVKRPQGKLIWINASSIGEYLATISLIKKIRKIRPKTKILLTTNTKTSALLAQKITDKCVFHQFTPQDNPLVIKKFLNYWKPSLVLWMETEFWPIILNETKNYGIEIILLNGRMSDKSFKNWNYFKFFFKEIISNFSLILTMSKIDQRNFKKLGAKNVNFIGNLKFCNEKQIYDKNLEKKAKNIIGNRPIWLAASTHQDEEVMAGLIHFILKYKFKFKNLLTVIVPRNTKRSKNIKKTIINSINRNWRSEPLYNSEELERNKDRILINFFNSDSIERNTDIIIDNSIGQLEMWYKNIKTVFLGKSLPPKGGQNPIEPAKYGCEIFSGPMSNFKEIEIEMKDKKCLVVINQSGLGLPGWERGGLGEQIRYSLQISEGDIGSDVYPEISQMGKNNKKYVQSKSFILDKTIKTIKKYLV